MWVKTTYYSHPCLLLVIRKSIYNLILVQTYTTTQAPTYRKLQPSLVLQLLLERELHHPSSCTIQYVYQYVGANLQKTPLFYQGPRFMNFQTGYSWNTTPQSKGHVSSNFHTGPINNIETKKIITAIQSSNTFASTNHFLNQPQLNQSIT